MSPPPASTRPPESVVGRRRRAHRHRNHRAAHHQYLEEADRLADQVVVLDHGRIAGHGTPAELKSLVGGTVVQRHHPALGLDTLPRRPDTATPVSDGRAEVSFTLTDAAAAAALVGHLTIDTITALDVAPPSLDDVFFHLAATGTPT